MQMEDRERIARGSEIHSAKRQQQSAGLSCCHSSLEEQGEKDRIGSVLLFPFVFVSLILSNFDESLGLTLLLTSIHPSLHSQSSFYLTKYEPIYTINTSTSISNPRTGPVPPRGERDGDNENRPFNDSARAPKDIRGSTSSSDELNHLTVCAFNSMDMPFLCRKTMQRRYLCRHELGLAL